MIRNYYTDSYKSGVVPIISATQLIDGAVKITQTVAVGNNLVNLATSVTLVIPGQNPLLKRGMYITAPASAGGNSAWTINDLILVEAIARDATNTTITLNKPKGIAVNTAITFFTINQSSWKEYNLYIGTSPTSFEAAGGGVVTTAFSNAAAGSQTILGWKQPIAIGVLASGMLVYDDGVLIGSISTIDSTTQITLVSNLAGAVADLSKLTFVYPGAPSLSVLTIDNQTVTITSPAQGFVLPLSVAQITGTANGLGNIIALE
jgi:hypothetical protein|tara:strand:- start:2159 stop:2944 length:786 start_codon:yes stop_codon:yes gene_type:complete